VTYYDTKNAFTAIENGGKLRKPDELPFDLCFGGRRQFLKTSYADLGELWVSKKNNIEILRLNYSGCVAVEPSRCIHLKSRGMNASNYN